MQRRRRPFSYRPLSFETEEKEADTSGRYSGLAPSPFRLKLGSVPLAEPDVNSLYSSSSKDISFFDDDPHEPMAENEVDFQPLYSTLTAGLTHGHGQVDSRKEEEAGGLGLASSSRLEIQPGHQHRTVSSLRSPSLTFVSPPAVQEEHMVQSSAIQVSSGTVQNSKFFLLASV